MARPTPTQGWAPPVPPTPSPSPASKSRGWVAPVVIVAVIAFAAGAVFALAGGSDGGDGSRKVFASDASKGKSSDDATAEEGAGKPPATTSTTPVTTSLVPRTMTPAVLDAYCTTPGQPWPDVPRHQPGADERVQVEVPRQGLDNATNTDPHSAGWQSPSAEDLGGSTVISPHTDHAFAVNGVGIERTRAVACVTFMGTDSVGTECRYEDMGAVYGTPRLLGKNRFEVTVYELHSGGILHKGEIFTSAPGCPRWAIPDEGGDLVAYPLTNPEILDWFGSHFVDGKPA